MKRAILVEIDVDPVDPKRCGAFCIGWMHAEDVDCTIFQADLEFSEYSDIRCLQCLEAETAAHLALRGGSHD